MKPECTILTSTISIWRKNTGKHFQAKLRFFEKIVKPEWTVLNSTIAIWQKKQKKIFARNCQICLKSSWNQDLQFWSRPFRFDGKTWRRTKRTNVKKLKKLEGFSYVSQPNAIWRSTIARIDHKWTIMRQRVYRFEKTRWIRVHKPQTPLEENLDESWVG